MIKNIFNTLYGYATYKPHNRGNQFKQNKSTPKMAFQVPIIAPVSALTKIQINNNNPILQKVPAIKANINNHETQVKVQNFYKLLDATSLALTESDIPFYLDCGTLLGCIREGKILSHDTDVDSGLLGR